MKLFFLINYNTIIIQLEFNKNIINENMNLRFYHP